MEREKQADKETAKQKEIIEFKAESAKAEDSEQEKSSQVITLMYCNYVLKRLWEDDLQLDQKIKELKKTRKELRFDLNSAAEYMCFCKAILPDSEEYGLIDRDSFLGNPVGNMYYDDFEQTFNFLEDNENKLIISLTPEGEQLKKMAIKVPSQMQGCIPLSEKDMILLRELLNRALVGMNIDRR